MYKWFTLAESTTWTRIRAQQRCASWMSNLSPLTVCGIWLSNSSSFVLWHSLYCILPRQLSWLPYSVIPCGIHIYSDSSIGLGLRLLQRRWVLPVLALSIHLSLLWLESFLRPLALGSFKVGLP